ncbi:hypothetical protein [Salipiger abyssi]|uniref:Uncharacterized protein n=1 Tax=Salipiger abyssi TaxID=1250539 RepID=A0A1P8UPB2_9RHOB|nr:hypothetical protein [Salipiger abyssi]APZ51244.1 hypothetical protein Ga0080574_TMP910 [Salipiger abyssi]MBN9890102.1 hypothetical protein [Salipiger abyssi]
MSEPRTLPRDVLARIPDLSVDELRGWWAAVFVWKLRPVKTGEPALLGARARELGVTL